MTPKSTILALLLLTVTCPSLTAAASLDLEPCPATIDPERADRTVVQTIGGSLFVWGEFDLADGASCLVLERPTLRPLSVADAKLLLDASREAQELATSSRSVSATRAAPGSRRVAPVERSIATRGVAALAQRVAGDSSTAVRRRLSRASTSAATDAQAGPLRSSHPLVFGSDDRVRVSNTDDFPWRTIVYVESEFPNGQIFGFSGVMIGPYSVLTSALAIYQSDRGGFADSVLVVPGQAQDEEGGDIFEPFGSQFGEFIEVPQAWVDSESAPDLYGAVLLAETFDGIEDTMPLVFNALPAGTVNLAGYDQQAQGEVDSYAQWFRSGQLEAIDSVYFDHRMDDDAGAIGAPLWELFNNQTRRIFGLNCCVNADDSANVGLRLISSNQDLITEWADYVPDNGNGDGDGDGDGGDNPDPDPGAPPLTIGGSSGNRFRITVGWEKPNGQTGDGQPIELTSDTGYFWFFRDDNVEFLIKVLNGCSINGHYWVYAGGLTDVQVSVLVEDTETPAKWRAFNPQGNGFESIQDISALEACP